jgi:pimeloyl-ACP methyl ester carboxylesterase
MSKTGFGKRGWGPITLLLSLAGFTACACGPGGESIPEPALPVYQKSIQPDLAILQARLALQTEANTSRGGRISTGTFAVPENRFEDGGRLIHLDVIVLHARAASPFPDPYFPLAGGPGQDVTRSVRGYVDFWVRDQRDIVLVSQRGTGGDNRLDCDVNGHDGDLQTYLGPIFTVEDFQACLRRLQQEYDLSRYSTFDAAEDINELRLALGYEKINIDGTSYGTRMALIYMRQHPETVRSAMLSGVVPIANKNPLYHAPAAHEAVRLLLAECAADPDCSNAYPGLEDEFLMVLERLGKQAKDVTVSHPATGVEASITLSRSGFAEALRTMMYTRRGQSQLPRLIHQAFEGDYRPFAQAGLERERALRRILAFGHLLCITCAEDVDRITEEEILKATTGTFQGDERVRDQIAICEIWPRSRLPEDFGDPVSEDIPTLILSGDLDPVTPPRWGEEVASHLPRSLHIIAPGAHGVGGTCIISLRKAFLESASIEGLDTSCIRRMRPLRFQIR